MAYRPRPPGLISRPTLFFSARPEPICDDGYPRLAPQLAQNTASGTGYAAPHEVQKAVEA